LRLTQDVYNYLKGHLLNLTFKIMSLEKPKKNISELSPNLEQVSSEKKLQAAKSTLGFAEKIKKGLRIGLATLMPFMSAQMPTEVQAKDGVNTSQDVTAAFDTEDIKRPAEAVEQIDNITTDETIHELAKGGVLEKQENPNPNGDVKLNVVNVGDIIVMNGEKWRVLENNIDKKLLVVRGVSDSNLDTVLNIGNKSKDDVIVVSPEGRIPAKAEQEPSFGKIVTLAPKSFTPRAQKSFEKAERGKFQGANKKPVSNQPDNKYYFPREIGPASHFWNISNKERLAKGGKEFSSLADLNQEKIQKSNVGLVPKYNPSNVEIPEKFFPLVLTEENYIMPLSEDTEVISEITKALGGFKVIILKKGDLVIMQKYKDENGKVCYRIVQSFVCQNPISDDRLHKP